MFAQEALRFVASSVPADAGAPAPAQRLLAVSARLPEEAFGLNDAELATAAAAAAAAVAAAEVWRVRACAAARLARATPSVLCVHCQRVAPCGARARDVCAWRAPAAGAALTCYGVLVSISRGHMGACGGGRAAAAAAVCAQAKRPRPGDAYVSGTIIPRDARRLTIDDAMLSPLTVLPESLRPCVPINIPPFARPLDVCLPLCVRPLDICIPLCAADGPPRGIAAVRPDAMLLCARPLDICIPLCVSRLTRAPQAGASDGPRDQRHADGDMHSRMASCA